MDKSQIKVLLFVLFGLIGLILLFYLLKKSKLKEYFNEAYTELIHKVTWPSWTELQGSAIAVMIASVIVALIIFIMDISFQKVMEGIYGLFY